MASFDMNGAVRDDNGFTDQVNLKTLPGANNSGIYLVEVQNAYLVQSKFDNAPQVQLCCVATNTQKERLSLYMYLPLAGEQVWRLRNFMVCAGLTDGQGRLPELRTETVNPGNGRDPFEVFPTLRGVTVLAGMKYGISKKNGRPFFRPHAFWAAGSRKSALEINQGKEATSLKDALERGEYTPEGNAHLPPVAQQQGYGNPQQSSPYGGQAAYGAYQAAPAPAPAPAAPQPAPQPAAEPAPQPAAQSVSADDPLPF